MRIFIDNTTAVAYINNMGGTHSLERIVITLLEDLVVVS